MTSSEWKKGYDPTPGRAELLEIRRACMSGNLSRFTEIFEGGEWYEAQVAEFLRGATRRGYVPIVRFLLGKGVAIGNAPLAAFSDRFGATKTDILEALMEYGWRVNDADSENQVVLPWAAADEYMVKWLLDRGADPNLGITLGAMTRLQDSQSSAEQIRTHQEEETRISQLVSESMQNASDSAKNAIRENITKRMSQANILSFQREGTDLAAFFFRNKAVGRIRQERGCPPPGNRMILDIENGPPYPNSGDALNSAAAYGNIAVFNLLIERGAKLDNSLALHYAAKNEHPNGIAMPDHLLALGLDINGTDDVLRHDSRGTPLHHAVDYHCVDIARFLLENGADPDKKNRLGVTPISWLSLEWKDTKTFIELFDQYAAKNSKTIS